jgi:superfamily I DNA and/or RNA helicase
MPILHIEQLAPRVGKSDLLKLLDREGGLPGKRVGRIELAGGRATVEVPGGWEVRLARALDGATLGGVKIRAWAGAPAAGTTLSTADAHFERLVRLLETEREAEAQGALERSRRLAPADAERTGSTLIDLAIADEEAGLGGRYLLTLVKRQRTALPWTRLGVGSPVVLSPQGAESETALRGVIYERREASVSLAVASLPDDLEDFERWRLDLSSDEISSQRQRVALERVAAARGNRLAQLRDVLLGQRALHLDEPSDEPPLDEGLNRAQRDAVNFALSARDVALIHGPPGTGKTTTVVELIRRAVRRGEKVLACGPSNMAVDNLFVRLLAHGERVVRLGHPARVMPQLRSHTLDLLVERHEDVRLARKLVKDALALFRRAARTTRAKPEPGARREMRAEAKSLLSDARRLEARAVEHILDTADILCATSTGLDENLLGDRQFDLAVIDEACQSTEPGSWIPVVRATKVVLAGDHCQLPPTVKSDDARRQGFDVSLFERLAEMYGTAAVRRLDVQYRMHHKIMEFSSSEFYEAGLIADASVEEHVLAQLPGVAATPLTQTALEFIDTAGAGYEEELEPDGESRLNRREAELICTKVHDLIKAGVSAADIGVITPYAAQARLLAERLNLSELEIDTVDGFQGREKEAILISLVRSNENGEIGFLSDVRRMNVAMTRARRKLLIVGDSATLSSDPFYARLISHFESQRAYRTVWEEDAGT